MDGNPRTSSPLGASYIGEKMSYGYKKSYKKKPFKGRRKSGKGRHGTKTVITKYRW